MEQRALVQRALRRVTPQMSRLPRASVRVAPEMRRTVIEADRVRAPAELLELWRARETAFVFAWRDVKVRYKQSLIGIAWAILQPLLTMVIFTLIFGKFARFPSQQLPYQVFVFTGLLPWAFFSTALSQISSSVVSNRALVQKVYFPRLILPLSGVLVPAVDFCCSAVVLGGIMAWYHTHLRVTALLAPLFLLILIATALGVGAAFATANVRYRDVPYAVPFIVQTWLYVSPVIYPSAALPHKWQIVTAFNPAVAGITGFRWALTGTPPPSTLALGLGVPMTLVLLVVGLTIYRRGETRFADTI